MKILSVRNNPKLGKENVFVSLWESYKSLSFFIRLSILTSILILVSIPFIVNNTQIFNPKAKTLEEIPSIPNKKPDIVRVSQPPQFVSDQILMKFKQGVSKQTADDILKANNATLLDEIPQIKVKLLKVDNEMARDAIIQAFSHNPNVEFAEKNGIAEAVGTTNDPDLSKQWGLFKVNAPQAWDVTAGSATASIAVVDTGIDSTHPDLASKVTDSINFSSSPTANDLYGHGTHVAGIAAAATNDSVGVAGLGYNSTIKNVKVLDDTGLGEYSWVANGIVWAADHGANVINMSLGGTAASSTMEDAVNYAWGKGVVVVAAAGNSFSTDPSYPAYYQNAIAVAATDSNDLLVSFSNSGDWVDVAAPGVSIYSSVPMGTCPLCDSSGYKYLNGTSMASPHAAGLAALVFTKVTDTNGNGFLNDEVRNCIESNTDNKGTYPIAGGRINAYKAVLCSSAAPSPTPTGTLAPTPTQTPTPTLIPTPTPVPGDITPPTTTVTSPLNGGIVTRKSIITITSSATDNVGISKVEFYVNNSLKCTDTTSPYYCTWNVPAAPNKTYNLQSKAYDTSNNTGLSPIVSVTTK